VDGRADGDRDFQERRRSQAESLIQGAAEQLREHGLPVETAVRIGNPRSIIVEEAKEWSADLVIVGSRSPRSVHRWSFGSVSRYVVGHVPCSVEVVRAKHRARHRGPRWSFARWARPEEDYRAAR
jgi:nucleotide-binding universal stress UspA family protein